MAATGKFLRESLIDVVFGFNIEFYSVFYILNFLFHIFKVFVLIFKIVELFILKIKIYKNTRKKGIC